MSKKDKFNWKDHVIDKSIGLVVALVTYLFYTYMSSFVTHAEYNHDKAESKTHLIRLESKVDNGLRAMCIINEKTCKFAPKQQ